MAKYKVVYADGDSQNGLKEAVMSGLSGPFDVEFAEELTSRLVDDLLSRDELFGLVTHFPIGVQGVLMPFGEGEASSYAGAAHLIRTLRCGILGPIVVYTGAGGGTGDDFMKGLITGSGANDIVFKNNLETDVWEIRSKMLELTRRS